MFEKPGIDHSNGGEEEKDFNPFQEVNTEGDFENHYEEGFGAAVFGKVLEQLNVSPDDENIPLLKQVWSEALKAAEEVEEAENGSTSDIQGVLRPE